MADPTITCRYLRVRGRTVHYRHCGRGAPVVLLHASPRSSAALVPLMRAAPGGFALFAIDLPGFGRSDPLPDPATSIEPFADSLVATLDALGLGRVHLYGTHTGAAVSVASAVRHPDRIGALVLDGLSTFTRNECAALDEYLPPFEPNADGTHMAWAWNRMRDQALFFPWHVRRTDTRLTRPIPAPDQLQQAVLDLSIAADYRGAYSAAFRTDARAWVARLAIPARIGARPDDVLLSHLDRLGPVATSTRVGPFSADVEAWKNAVWFEFAQGPSLEDAPAPVDPGPGSDLHSGPPGARTHWRCAGDPRDRPLVLLHDSPGSARVLDARMRELARDRFVLACDLPGHAESDATRAETAASLVDDVAQAIGSLGIDEAELDGIGIGATVASTMAARAPHKWTSFATSDAALGRVDVPIHLAARADGGHLSQAWFDARDTAILGPWWSRDPTRRHDFGDALDLRAIQTSAVERLLEAPQAARLRHDWATLHGG